MPIEIISTKRLGYEPDCRICGAGSLTNFNWLYAQNHPHAHNLYAYESSKKLRIGSLFKCKSCSHPWYLDKDELFMNSVPLEKLELIEEWNISPIHLTNEQLEILTKIGSTPPDIYGNGRQYRQTPCRVVAKTGEIFNFAIISQQQHTPFEEHRKYRLVTEIQDIQPSPCALPLEVRIATTQAEEMSYGFAPTVVEKPNGDRMILNWTQDFYDRTDCLAADIKIAKDYKVSDCLSNIFDLSAEITYFLADI